MVTLRTTTISASIGRNRFGLTSAGRDSTVALSSLVLSYGARSEGPSTLNTGHLPVDSSVGRPSSTREWLGLAVAAMLAMVAFAISSAGGNVPVVRADGSISVNFTVDNRPYDGSDVATFVGACTLSGTDRNG